MSAVTKIQEVLATGLLIPQLTIIPSRGALDEEIRQEEVLLRRRLCFDHVAILRCWNGIALDVVRLFGCGENASNVGRISSSQIKNCVGIEGAITIGSDAAGFVYLQTCDGHVWVLDSDGGKVEQLADNLDDFFERLVFGQDAISFGGPEWMKELRDAGVVRST